MVRVGRARDHGRPGRTGPAWPPDTMNDSERKRLLDTLAADRRALLDSVRAVDPKALRLATRNPGWTVGHVLAHVLAADADLIAFLEGACTANAHVRILGKARHELEMERWMTESPSAIVTQLRDRGRRWQRLLASLPEPSLDIGCDSGKSPGTVGETVGHWVGHDVQHREDVELALAVGRGTGCGLFEAGHGHAEVADMSQGHP